MKRMMPLLLLSVVAVGVALKGQQSAEETMAGLKPAEGLSVTLFASEPMVTNPTNIAVDERGRVWVTEGVNYRRTSRMLPIIRPEGDRILILEDTNQDGKADKVKVFDQSPDYVVPLGIAVHGDKVIVSHSPDIIVYTKDAEDNIISKEVLLTGFEGFDHDHGVHAVTFGPDGKYYFNHGNVGFDVTDRSGNRYVSQETGAETREGYYQGVILRMNPDGTDLEVLAQNFRNPYEVGLDSFGNMLQVDNDDDGTEWNRLDYIMEGGNYGYRGPLHRTWREDGGTHWHHELPGVIPTVERLGAGSPCGLMYYEATLFPTRYRSQFFHAEPGRRALEMYPLTDDGAGFVGGTEDVLNMGDDTWARPVDVAVAPDGAMLIADWYDPGVGGHMMGDPDGSQGRIYRLAPVGNTPQVPAVDLQSTEGLAAAFRSGNESVRYLAYRAIEAQGDAAVPMLQEWWREGDPILQARALWLLGGLGTAGNAAIQEALGHSEPRFRILGLRVARLHGADMIRVSKPLLRDPSPQVRREIALMLRDPSKMLPAYGYPEQGPATEEWLSAMAELAAQYDGQDRWYVEALGIAARGREEALYARLSAQSGTRLDGPFGRLLWVLRPRTALPDLIATINDASRSVPERLAALDAIGAMEWPEAAQAIEAFILAESTPELVERAFGLYSHQLGSQWMDSLTSPELPAVMQKALSLPATQPAAVVVATTLADPRYLPDLVALAKTASADPEARAGAVAAISATGGEPYLSDFQALAGAGPLPVRIAAMRAVSALAPPNVENWTQGILLSDAPNEVRVQALRLLGGTVPGLNLILDMAESGTLPPEFESLARSLTNFARPPLTERQQRSPVAMRVPRTEMPTDPAYVAIRERAAKILPLPDRTIPTAFELDLSYAGKVDAGRQLFETGAGCAPCHSLSRLGDSRRTLGMDLSTIGQKFDKQAMLDDLLNPNGAIQPEYVATVFTLRDGGEVEGLITAETPDQVTVVVGQQEQRLSTSEIASRRPVQISPMPEGLLDNLSLQQIADLLAFLDTLR